MCALFTEIIPHVEPLHSLYFWLPFQWLSCLRWALVWPLHIFLWREECVKETLLVHNDDIWCVTTPTCVYEVLVSFWLLILSQCVKSMDCILLVSKRVVFSREDVVSLMWMLASLTVISTMWSEPQFINLSGLEVIDRRMVHWPFKCLLHFWLMDRSIECKTGPYMKQILGRNKLITGIHALVTFSVCYCLCIEWGSKMMSTL